MTYRDVTPLVTPPEVEGEVRSTPLLLATSAADELAAAIQNLRDRGVTNPDEFVPLGAVTLADTVRWFDWERQRRDVSAGVLVVQLRAGGKPGWRPPQAAADATLQRQAEYGAAVRAWLRQHFPELDRPVWGPHPAAVAAVIRLHHAHGKGSLTRAAHGPEIRAAVATWKAKWGDA